jgi:hypothetical protein
MTFRSIFEYRFKSLCWTTCVSTSKELRTKIKSTREIAKKIKRKKWQF